MEKKKRIKRKDHFRRIKNKSEPVYRTPGFLKNTAEVSEISESGIFRTGGRYSKGYFMESDVSGELAGIFTKLRKMNAAYAFLNAAKNEKICLIVDADKKNMPEAIAWFSLMEQETGLKGINAEERLEYYCSFLTSLLCERSRADSYLLETESWKPLADMNSMKADDNLIRTEAGVFQVMAISRFPDKILYHMPTALTGHEAVLVSYTEINPIADSDVRDMLNAQYMGIDGLLPRIKRGNPSLYNILKAEKEESEDMECFVSASMYFLLRAKDRESMDMAANEICNIAKEKGMRLEHVPVTELRMAREMKRMISMFGMSGKGLTKYRNLILSADKERLFPQTGESPKEESYDIEELRALFYK